MLEDNIYKGSQKGQDTPKNKENTATSKEVEYDWGKHPNSQKAIKKHQFPKGISGNIMGKKPKFDKLAAELKKLCEEETFNWSGEKSLGTRKSQVYERIWKDAIMGDIKKIQLLAWLGCLD